MNQNDKPYSHSKPNWENNPKWLFDAYRLVALKKDSENPNAYKRFIEYLATTDNLIDPEKIGIKTDDKNNLVAGSGYYGEKVIAPFLPLIEAVTDEMLEMGKVVGYEYLDGMTQKASNDLQQGMQQYIKDAGAPTKESAEKWALRGIRLQLRDKVAAAMFRGIREYAFVEHAHREHLISDTQYEETLEKIGAGLDKIGFNGLAKFLKANPQLEDILQTDDRKFVPYNYKMPDKDTGALDATWFPNNREKKQFKRSDYYAWQMYDLEGKQGNPPFADWDYENARLTALYNIVGPDYCEAVKKRDSVMRKYTLGHGGQSSTQTPNNYTKYLGYDLSNEELKHLVNTGGNADISAQEAEIVYNVNNALGAYDPRLNNQAADKKTEGQQSQISNDDDSNQAQKKTSDTGSKKSPDKIPEKDGDAANQAGTKEGQDSPRQDQTSTNNAGSSHSGGSSSSTGSDDAHKKDDSKDKKTATGIKVGSAVLGSILIADQLHRVNKKGQSDAAGEQDAPGTGPDDKRKEKSSKAVNYVIAAVAAAGIGVIVFTKPEKLVKFVDSFTEFFKGKGKS